MYTIQLIRSGERKKTLWIFHHIRLIHLPRIPWHMALFALFFPRLLACCVCVFFCIESNEKGERKKNCIARGKYYDRRHIHAIVTRWICVFTYSAYYGNAYGDVLVVAQQTLNYYKPLVFAERTFSHQRSIAQTDSICFAESNNINGRKKIDNYIYILKITYHKMLRNKNFAGMILTRVHPIIPKEKTAHKTELSSLMNKSERKISTNLESIKTHASCV